MKDYQSHPDYLALPKNLKDRYDDLPKGMRLLYTPKEFAWLSDEDKDSMEERDTLPDD